MASVSSCSPWHSAQLLWLPGSLWSEDALQPHANSAKAHVPVGTSHRQNEYFKFHMALYKLKPSMSRWCGWWYRESSLVGCPLSLWLPCTVTRQMLPSTGAVGLRVPLQLSFLEERLVEELMQLLGAAFSPQPEGDLS